MKCPNCGAEIKVNSKYCEFCSSSITTQMRREQEQLNKAGCPKCGSSNISFYREKQGELREKCRTAVVYSTVGVCKDCGYTWQTDNDAASIKQSRTWLWVLGWICIFPLPLTILLLRKKELKPAFKYGIIAVAWIIYLIIGLGGKSINTDTVSNKSSSSSNPTFSTFAEPKGKLQPNDSVEITAVLSEDIVVNRFINEFNHSSQYEITEITKGNIHTKYFGYANGRYIEMINANSAAAEAFCLTINGGRDEAEKQSMYEVFRAAVKVLDPSISNDDIDAVLAEFDKKDVLIEGYPMGDSITVTYVPTKELSYGKNSCRMDLFCSNYK